MRWVRERVLMESGCLGKYSWLFYLSQLREKVLEILFLLGRNWASYAKCCDLEYLCVLVVGWGRCCLASRCSRKQSRSLPSSQSWKWLIQKSFCSACSQGLGALLLFFLLNLRRLFIIKLIACTIENHWPNFRADRSGIRLTAMCLPRQSSFQSRTSERQWYASWPSVTLCQRLILAYIRFFMTGVHLLALKNSGIDWNLRSEDQESKLVEEVFGSSSLMMKGEHSQDWHSLYRPKEEALLLGEKTICWQTSPRGERSSLSALWLVFDRLKDYAVFALSLMFEAFFSSFICPFDRATASFLGLMLLMIWMHWLAWLLLRECGKGKSFCRSVADGCILLVLGSSWRIEESTDLLCCCLLELNIMRLELGEVVFLRVEVMPLGLDIQFSRGLSTRREARLFLEKMNLRLLKGLRCFSSQMVRCVFIPSQFLVSRCWWTRQRRFRGTFALQLFAKDSTTKLVFLKSPAYFANSSANFPSIPSHTGSLFSLTIATTSATIS